MKSIADFTFLKVCICMIILGISAGATILFLSSFFNAKRTTLDYEHLMQEPVRDAMKQTLAIVAKNGISDNYHFNISFKTNYPGVDLPDYLKKEYPDIITIVLQHEFWDLEVNNKNFCVTLIFNDVHKRIAIPFDSVVSFSITFSPPSK